MKTYIAGPFFNEIQLDIIKRIEAALDAGSHAYFSPRSDGNLGAMRPEERASAAKRVYQSNITNMKRCEVMVAVLDGGDVGTSFEMGYFNTLRDVGFQKTLITVTDSGKALNVMLAEGTNAHVFDIDARLTATMNEVARGEINFQTVCQERRAEVY